MCDVLKLVQNSKIISSWLTVKTIINLLVNHGFYLKIPILNLFLDLKNVEIHVMVARA